MSAPTAHISPLHDEQTAGVKDTLDPAKIFGCYYQPTVSLNRRHQPLSDLAGKARHPCLCLPRAFSRRVNPLSLIFRKQFHHPKIASRFH